MKKLIALSIALLMGADPVSAASTLDSNVSLPDLTARSYSMGGADARVIGAGVTEGGLHLNSSNFVHSETRPNGALKLRWETETLLLDIRHGFRVKSLPVEVGMQVSAYKDASGFQNGFIESVEKLVGASNDVRLDPTIPHGESFIRNGQVVRSYERRGSGVGDVLLSVKTELFKSDRLGVAVRGVLNLDTGARVTSKGKYAGMAVTGAYRAADKWTLNGDLRATLPLERHDPMELPLAHVAFGATMGVAYAWSPHTSLVAQIDTTQSAYKNTGFTSYDAAHGGISLGINHIGKNWIMGKDVLIQGYLRENFQPSPIRLINNSDSDFQLGVRTVVQF